MASKTNPWLIEAKAVAATAASAGVGIGIGVLNDTAGNGELLGTLPGPVQWIALVVIPPLVTFMSAWKAKHTSRPDLGA